MPRAVREQQMLDAAVAVFSRRGYHAAAMDEIAEQAGVSKPMLYFYLGSKEELFAACIRREADRLTEAIATAVSVESSADRQLWEGLRAFFVFVAEHRDSWVVLYQQARAQGESIAREVSRARRVIIDNVADLVRASGGGRVRGGEPEAVAHALVGAADALSEWALGYPDEPPERSARRVMDLMWVGLERRAQGERYEP
ncbi:TetR family transcriptional regulator [Mangrovactinospora gilvigrisea]|uniref:TetR family transcriptional regulator n=1 Tax=Mangrovactinospora gilvigrisea TaxID=1428644 RepID=A0A1J7CHR2_9ACTN|nr:TetR family transcriptional regulator [Mangrovactinospora gilvigrisea]